jgi:hypothetical protein
LRASRVPRVIWIITVLHVLILVGYSMLFAPFRPPDEPQHIDLVRAVRHDVGYPRYDERNLSEPIVNALPLVQFDVPAVRSRELRKEAAPPRASRLPFSKLGRDDVQVPLHPNQLPSHPPLYYAVAAATQTVVNTIVPGARDWSFDREIAVLRLLSVALAAPLPLLAFAVARRLRWSMHVAVAASMLPLAIPQLSHIGSSVSNDNLLTLLLGVCTLLVARIASEDDRWPTAVALGVVGGLAMLTKAFALVVPVWIIAAQIAAVRGGARWRGAVQRGAASLALAFVFGGWWWARNLLVFGKLQTGIKLLPPAPSSFAPDPGWWVRRFGAFMPERFWGWFGWFDVRVPVAIAAVATAVVLLGVARALLMAARRRGLRSSVVLLLAPTVGILLLVLMGSYQGYLRTGFDEGIQGRYLFPGLVGLAPVVALGLTRFARGDGRHVPFATFVGAMAMQVVGVAVILSFYWGGSSPIGRLESVAAWSPWPTLVPAAVGVGVLLCVALTGAELWRLGHRRLEAVTTVPRAVVRRSA